MIAFVGSVFSPYYARDRAHSPAASPLDHCAINVAIYGPGHRRWVLSEYPREAVGRSAEGLAIGASSLAWEGDCLRIRFAERAAVSGRPVEGELRLFPSATFDAPQVIDHRGRHCWWPVAPQSRIEVEIRRPRPLRFAGAGYHDANFGAEPLEEGFHAWTWSRVRQGDRTLVLYDAHRRDDSTLRLGLDFAADGSLGSIEAPQAVALGRTRWGLERSTRCDAGGRARVIRTLTDAPFYARSEIVSELGGAPARGVHEALSLDRFRSRLVQHMLTYKIRREHI
ncbi:MAG: carotenoid 1,2-hydratase [Myxococcales bacterium]|nr:carotenoid 1,2-hydratase [Myxococcales bacterium]